MTTLKFNKEKLEKKLQISKFKLLNYFPFFGILALYFRYEIDESIDTAGTDGKRIIFSPKFLDELTISELNWVLAHEIMHVANGHLRRTGSRRPDVFNYAADFAVHSILKDFENESFKMPKEGLYDVKYKGWAVEQIYDDLYEQMGKDLDKKDKMREELAKQMLDNHDIWGKPKDGNNERGKGDGEGKEGGGESGGKQEEEISEEEWNQRMLNAAKVASAKSCGKNSSFLNKLLAKLTPPKKDWRTLLQEFIIPEIFDYSFNPPDKRFQFGSDCLIPDFNDTDDAVKNIVFYIDISGSMSDKDISEVYSEVVGALSQFSNMSGYLGYFDTSVHSFKKFEDVSDILENKPHSGGGTEFRVCFEYIHKLDKNFEIDKEDISGIVLLTDGYCGFEKCEKLAEGIPVLWVMTENIDPAPFGSTIYLRNYEDNNLNI